MLYNPKRIFKNSTNPLENISIKQRKGYEDSTWEDKGYLSQKKHKSQMNAIS